MVTYMALSSKILTGSIQLHETRGLSQSGHRYNWDVAGEISIWDWPCRVSVSGGRGRLCGTVTSGKGTERASRYPGDPLCDQTKKKSHQSQMLGGCSLKGFLQATVLVHVYTENWLLSSCKESGENVLRRFGDFGRPTWVSEEAKWRLLCQVWPYYHSLLLINPQWWDQRHSAPPSLIPEQRFIIYRGGQHVT